jgi:Na+-transporting NADH:ubiquinone oxidoreductase subunit D
MGRLEAFAMANKPWRSFLDGIGNGLGYGLILIMVAATREVFGKGSFAGFQIIGNTPEYLLDTTQISWLGWYSNNNLMVLPAAAMFIIGIIIWIQRSYNTKLVDIS